MIDEAFLERWYYRCDEIEKDEPEYQAIIKIVATEIADLGTLTQPTFIRILDWKDVRVKNLIQREHFAQYQARIAESLDAPAANKLKILMALRGIGPPVGSAILHFIYPDKIPVFGVRTVEALYSVGLLSSLYRDERRFSAYMAVIRDIAARYPGWSLRKIDRALSAYHKIELERSLRGVRPRSVEKPRFIVTKSGVKVFDDFRDNLIIDRYHPVFYEMRDEKKEQLKSENSEDAISWNVWQSLRQIDPAIWLPRLFGEAFGEHLSDPIDNLNIDLWLRFPPPPTLVHEEGESEIDIVLATEGFVWFIEAKYKSDISLSVSHDGDRDQILRNIDVGSWYAGPRDYYFTLLVLDDTRSPMGAEKLNIYNKKKNILLRLPHRTDGLRNLAGVGMLHWAGLVELLRDCAWAAKNEDEKLIADRARECLEAKI